MTGWELLWWCEVTVLVSYTYGFIGAKLVQWSVRQHPREWLGLRTWERCLYSVLWLPMLVGVALFLGLVGMLAVPTLAWRRLNRREAP